MAADPKLAFAFIDGSPDREFSTFRILGVRLRKFSLYHRLLLNTVDSPFMRNGPVSMFDIRVAVGACALEFGCSKIRKPRLWPFLLQVWAILISLILRRKPGQPRPLQRSLNRLSEELLEYFGEYLQRPEYAIIPPNRPAGMTPQVPRGRAPEEIEHVGELIAWGISEYRAWNMPIGQANWYRVMARRSGGLDVDFMSEEEKEFQENLPPEYRRGYQGLH